MDTKKRMTRFTQALNVMNAALSQNETSMPYKQILATADQLIEGKNFGVAVYESDPSSPCDYFTVRYHDHGFEFVSHGKAKPAITWKVSEDYLEKVGEHADEYIQHPAKLDWDWLTNRLGLG